jgi:hypothetical protein
MGLSQTRGVYPLLSKRNEIAPPMSEAARDPACPWREAEAPVQERLQGPPLRGGADPSGGLSWYLRYPLSYRDIEEMLLERSLAVDHSTLNRWVLAYAPLIERRLHSFRKPHCGSVRIDETYNRLPQASLTCPLPQPLP